MFYTSFEKKANVWAGAALGGLAGAGIGYASARPKDRLSDALAGGVLGAGIGASYRAGRRLSAEFDRDFARARRSQQGHQQHWDDFHKKWDDFNKGRQQQRQHWDDFHKKWDQKGEGFRGNFWDEFWGAGGSRGKGSGSGGGGFGKTFRSVEDHLSDLGMRKEHATSKRAIEKHFRAEAFKHHPDRKGNEEMFKKINNAREEIKKTSWYQNLPDDDFTKKAFFRAFERKLR